MRTRRSRAGCTADLQQVTSEMFHKQAKAHTPQSRQNTCSNILPPPQLPRSRILDRSPVHKLPVPHLVIPHLPVQSV